MNSEPTFDQAVIVDYRPEMAVAYKELVLSWVSSDFTVEPEDRLQAEDPVGSIIKPGGYIFMAQVAAQWPGTAALRKVDATTYEVCKMVVTPAARGHQLGQKLMSHLIAKARALGAQKLVLETSHKAASSVKLYLKNGFKQLPFPPHHPPGYARADIWMELNL